MLIFASLLMITHATKATTLPDTSSTSAYEKNVIYMQSTFLGVKYVKNGERIKLGHKHKNLLAEFRDNSHDAMKEYANYKSCNKKAGVLMGIYTAGVVAGAVLIEATP